MDDTPQLAIYGVFGIDPGGVVSNAAARLGVTTKAEFDAAARRAAAELAGRPPGTRDSTGVFAVSHERLRTAGLIIGTLAIGGVAAGMAGLFSPAVAVAPAAGVAAPVVELVSGMDVLGGVGSADAAALGLSEGGGFISAGTVSGAAGALQSALSPLLGAGKALRSLFAGGGDAPGAALRPGVTAPRQAAELDLVWTVGTVIAALVAIKFAKG